MLHRKNKLSNGVYRAVLATNGAEQGIFSSGLNSSLEHPWKVISELLNAQSLHIFTKGKLFYILWEYLLEPSISELYIAHVLECNLGKKGEGFWGRGDILTSGHVKTRAVACRAERASCLLGRPADGAPGIWSESATTHYDTISKKRLGI